MEDNNKMKLNIVTYIFALLFVMMISISSSTITSYILLEITQNNKINDYKLLQEISKRLEQQNGYEVDGYNCINYADDLENIGNKLGIGIHQISGKYNNKSKPGHRVNCLEFDAQTQTLTNLASKYDYIKHRD